MIRNRQITRQWTLLQALVETSVGLTLDDCCAAVGDRVTDRTIRRDIEALGSVFPVMRQRVDDVVRYRVRRSDLHWVPPAGARADEILFHSQGGARL